MRRLRRLRRAIELPVDPAAGNRTRPQAQIEQSSCNKDYSCVEGFCPSFVSVLGGTLKKPESVKLTLADLEATLAAYPTPERIASPNRSKSSWPASAAPASSPSAR
jgi:hypothetical protein